MHAAAWPGQVLKIHFSQRAIQFCVPYKMNAGFSAFEDLDKFYSKVAGLRVTEVKSNQCNIEMYGMNGVPSFGSFSVGFQLFSPL